MRGNKGGVMIEAVIALMALTVSILLMNATTRLQSNVVAVDNNQNMLDTWQKDACSIYCRKKDPIVDIAY